MKAARSQRETERHGYFVVGEAVENGGLVLPSGGLCEGY